MDEASPAILLSRLKELQHLLQSPGGEQQGPRVDTLAIFIARRAPNPFIRELAMRVMAEAAKLRRGEHAQNFDLNALLEQLQVAIAGAVASKPHR
ncbi:MAG TPA: hypothetical protein VFT23_07850 [Burkholderiales bacterium]|nr:hypothetical protein [Burkholderiales bacterium]